MRRPCGILLLSLMMARPLFAQPLSDAGEQGGHFWRVHWYERGLAHANPAYEGRFRVNSPEVVLHPTFGPRVEARENGLMLIHAEEDLRLITAAELYLEMWGGHPGTANKRVTVNGRSTYQLPRVGTEAMNCTYHYPTVPLRLTDLVNGYDAFQFAVDQGSTFWGHMLIDNACLRVALTNGHPDLVAGRLDSFQAAVSARPAGQGEAFELALELEGVPPDRVRSVDFQGYYFGYDENGDTLTKDWHGFTKGRQGIALIGTSDAAPFQATWDVRMLPAQKDVAVRAIVSLRGLTNVVYVTAPRKGIEIQHPPGRQVTLFSSHDLPQPFWSRAGQKRECTIYLDVDPRRIEQAELHVNAWTGGSGTVQQYFKLNEFSLHVAEGSKHELIYSRVPVEPSVLREGINHIQLLSDTEHHGIEILLPGPCLMIRSKQD